MTSQEFAVQMSVGNPSRIELREDELVASRPGSTTWETQGCPARISPAGGGSPIATLWSWCVELCHVLGLLR